MISDYRMPDMDGVAFLSRLIEIQPNISRLILSGYADLHALVGAINRVQIFRFIAKPWDDHELETAISQALAQRHLIMDNQRLADIVRVQEGRLTRQEVELKRLEELHPGLTKIKRGADGSIDLDLDMDDDVPYSGSGGSLRLPPGLKASDRPRSKNAVFGARPPDFQVRRVRVGGERCGAARTTFLLRRREPSSEAGRKSKTSARTH